MFRLSITTLSLLVALVLPAKTGQSAESCADLAAHYDRLNRHNALLFAESMGDNSAPRATVSELKQIDNRLKQLAVLDFMRAKKCEYPADVENSYILSAGKCALEELKGNYRADICDFTKWSPDKP